MRCSVRTLVEFTLHSEDICPGPSIRDMQEGMLGHKARQALLEEGWISESPISLTMTEDDELVEISGRMDAYRPCSPPAVEEIKLWHGTPLPEKPADAHWAQAMCYAHMLCERDGYASVSVRVVYVDRNGTLLASFTEEPDRSACREAFTALYLPWLNRMKQITAHQKARNASLQALAFPYAEYRAGQREMAVQVYTAIQRQKRLFASIPTGTGKSMAACFPALKALGTGLTEQIFYLTARTTQRQGPLEAIELLRKQSPALWSMTLCARDSVCPEKTICHPDWCPRAKGHYLRDNAAIDELMRQNDWSTKSIRQTADRHQLCPFELSLSLAEMADFIICDYNYAFDPSVHLQRVFDRNSNHVTLLIDEAHNLLPRAREMLSGQINSRDLRHLRTAVGKAAGRKAPLYKAITELLNTLAGIPFPDDVSEGRLDDFPSSIDQAAESLSEAFLTARTEHFSLSGDENDLWNDTSKALFSFVRARRQKPDGYVCLWNGSTRSRSIVFQCLDPSTHLAGITEKLSGSIFFSATLFPLEDMKLMLGGGEEDACFSAPSAFPPENLRILRLRFNTRYRFREQAITPINQTITQLFIQKPGKYIVYFPSFAFMEQCAQALDGIPFQLQRRSMNDEERAAFLLPYTEGKAPVLSLCVMGGIFSEGIDLPGNYLDGVIIVGTGLPQVNQLQNELMDYYQHRFCRGFLYAYQIPGMQKVVQAVGRVIRTETDHGLALLIDDRYDDADIRLLCPPHWQLQKGSLRQFLDENADLLPRPT